MAWKIVVLVITAVFGFSLSSCYPELSVQQYDKLKEDLAILDEQYTALEQELEYQKAELAAILSKNQEIRTYVDFMVQLINTQNSEGLLEGQFDHNTLVAAKDQLLAASEKLENGDIHYFLTLIDPENETQTIAAYNKAMEYCIKNIKQKLGVTSKP